MKKLLYFAIFVILIAGLLSACTQAVPPELFLDVPSPLMQGTQVNVHVSIDNSESTVIENASLILGYAQEGDSGIVQISEIPISLSEGQHFEQEIPWLINFQPVLGAKYQLFLLVLSKDDVELGQISTEITFSEPQISVAISPDQLAQNDQALIQVQVINSGAVAMHDYTLSVGYGAENDTSMILIQDSLINIEAGEIYQKEISWVVDYVPADGNYEIRAVLLMPGSVYVTQAVSQVILTAP